MTTQGAANMESVLSALWKSDVPEGRAGQWAVERFQIRRDPPPTSRLAGLRGHPEYGPPAKGTYTRLAYRETEIMSDTQDEWVGHRAAVFEAARRGGRVLVNGLGLGLVVESILRNPFSRVQGVVVVERAAEVIWLVGTHLQARYADRLQIVQADALSWRPTAESRYSVVWHDIWDRPDPAYLTEMNRLESRYRAICDWQGAWGKDYVEKYMTIP